MTDIDPRLEAALRSVFNPLASLLLKSGIGTRPVIQILKEAFVDAAISEHGKNGNPANISTAARITGMSRKTIRQMRSLDPDSEEIEMFSPSSGGRLLAFWNANREFHDRQGRPMSLNLGPGAGTFADLVEKSIAAKDVDEILSRLIKNGCVEIGSDGRVSMLQRDWPIASDVPRLLSDLGTLASTLNSNCDSDPRDSLTQRTAFAPSYFRTKRSRQRSTPLTLYWLRRSPRMTASRSASSKRRWVIWQMPLRAAH